MTTTEKITAGVMIAATLLLIKRNVLSANGVGLLLSWSGVDNPENLEPYRYPAWSPELKALDKAGKIRCYYNGQTYAIYTVPVSSEARVYHLACVIRNGVVYLAERIRTDERTKRALLSALQESFGTIVQPTWSNPETRWVYL